MSQNSSEWSVDTAFGSSLATGHQLLEEILSRLQDENWTQRDIFGIRLALEEAIVNAIKHGNRLDPLKRVHVCCRSTSEKIWIRIADEGQGFDPEKVPDCTDDEHIECPNGRGIMLMRNFMTFVEYSDSGKVVTMEKLRPTD